MCDPIYEYGLDTPANPLGPEKKVEDGFSDAFEVEASLKMLELVALTSKLQTLLCSSLHFLYPCEEPPLRHPSMTQELFNGFKHR